MAENAKQPSGHHINLNKITLRYQDAGKLNEYSEAQENLDCSFKYENNQVLKYESKNDKIPLKARLMSSNNPTLSRLSLSKFREGYDHGNTRVSTAYLNTMRSRNIKKVDSLITEIMPLVNSHRRSSPTFNWLNSYPKNYFEYISTYFPTPKSQKQKQRLDFNEETLSPTPRLPNAIKIKNKTKLFDLAFGINHKFVSKYMPIPKTKNHYFDTDKLPGHLALTKVIDDNKYLRSNRSTSNLEKVKNDLKSEIESARKEYTSLGNYFNVNSSKKL